MNKIKLKIYIVIVFVSYHRNSTWLIRQDDSSTAKKNLGVSQNVAAMKYSQNAVEINHSKV